MSSYKSVESFLYSVGSVVIFLLLSVFLEEVLAEKCYRDESLGDREGNVYHCESKDLPRCCTENEVQTCCIAESEKNLEEQLQLWGTVAGMILLIAILFVCCKNDVSFCNGETSLKERWHNFRHKDKSKEAHLVEKDENIKGNYYDNPIGDFGGPSNYYPPTTDPYNFPPLANGEKGKNTNGYNQSYA